MRMQSRKFRIGELAKQLDIERFVIRFWEKEFNLAPTRSTGGQRFYTERDLTTFTHIKDLLYCRGFTIVGAKKQLKTTKPQPIETKVFGSRKTTFEHKALQQSYTQLHKQTKQLRDQIQTLKQQIASIAKHL